jgi:hypothetical protein
MAKTTERNTRKGRNNKRFKENGTQDREINASTVDETRSYQRSPFGGILPLINFWI